MSGSIITPHYLLVDGTLPVFLYRGTLGIISLHLKTLNPYADLSTIDLFDEKKPRICCQVEWRSEKDLHT